MFTKQFLVTVGILFYIITFGALVINQMDLKKEINEVAAQKVITITPIATPTKDATPTATLIPLPTKRILVTPLPTK